MMLFQAPPITRYDLNFNLFGIPVRVHPIFWLMILLFASSTRGLLQYLIWVVVIFFSLLLHEMGHALVMRGFGRSSEVILYYGGGLTVPRAEAWGTSWANVSLTRKQEILVSFAGSFMGFFLVIILLAFIKLSGGSVGLTFLFGFLPYPMIQFSGSNVLFNSLLMSLIWVNLFWGIINLVPVLPLDGGSIAQQLFLITDPYAGQRKAYQLSLISGVVVAVAGLLLLRSLYLTMIFGYLAFQSYQAIKR
jgi:stage IV sporulation protein FB